RWVYAGGNLWDRGGRLRKESHLPRLDTGTFRLSSASASAGLQDIQDFVFATCASSNAFLAKRIDRPSRLSRFPEQSGRARPRRTPAHGRARHRLPSSQPWSHEYRNVARPECSGLRLAFPEGRVQHGRLFPQAEWERSYKSSHDE